MQLHKTTQYAIRILNYLALGRDRELHSAKEMSEALDIAYKFLTKIMTELVKAELVISIRGREGGFKLSKAPSQIRLSEILEIFNDLMDEDQCILGIGACDGRKKCALHDQWAKPKQLIRKMYEETTLEQLEGSGFKF